MKNFPDWRFNFSDEWKEKFLGEIVNISAGGDLEKEKSSLKKSDLMKYPVYANSLENNGLCCYASYYKIDGESVTVTGRGDIGHAVSRHEKFVPIVRLLVCKPIENLNVDFLAEVINTYKIIKESTGVPQLTAPQLKNLKIKLPSLDEQKKIAEYFSHLDKSISAQEKKLNSWRDMKKGLLQKIFSQEFRFADDNGNFYPDWQEKKLGEVAEKITRKNLKNQTDIALTISAQDGLIDQRNFFSKQIASKDMSNYFLLKNGEFAYNRSYSKDYNFGAIKRLDKYECGALSTLYIAFEFKSNEINSDYATKYFDSLIWYESIYKMLSEGARNHGLLNIYTEDFFKLKIKLPCIEEQKKIAEYFSHLDKIISSEQKILENLRQMKKGLLQKLFV